MWGALGRPLRLAAVAAVRPEVNTAIGLYSEKGPVLSQLTCLATTRGLVPIKDETLTPGAGGIAVQIREILAATEA